MTAFCNLRADLAKARQSVIERLVRLYKLKLRAIQVGDLEILEKLSDDAEQLIGLERSLRDKLQAHIASHRC